MCIHVHVCAGGRAYGNNKSNSGVVPPESSPFFYGKGLSLNLEPVDLARLAG